MGSDYRLLISDPVGAIAQLGERLLCKQEVVGSIPSGSTRLRAAHFCPRKLAEGAGPKADALSEKRFDANASQPNSFVEKFARTGITSPGARCLTS